MAALLPTYSRKHGRSRRMIHRKKQNGGNCHLLHLPVELILEIESHLPDPAALVLSQICSSLWDIFRDRHGDEPLGRLSRKDRLHFLGCVARDLPDRWVCEAHAALHSVTLIDKPRCYSVDMPQPQRPPLPASGANSAAYAVHQVRGPSLRLKHRHVQLALKYARLRLARDPRFAPWHRAQLHALLAPTIDRLAPPGGRYVTHVRYDSYAAFPRILRVAAGLVRGEDGVAVAVVERKERRRCTTGCCPSGGGGGGGHEVVGFGPAEDLPTSGAADADQAWSVGVFGGLDGWCWESVQEDDSADEAVASKSGSEERGDVVLDGKGGVTSCTWGREGALAAALQLVMELKLSCIRGSCACCPTDFEVSKSGSGNIQLRVWQDFGPEVLPEDQTCQEPACRRPSLWLNDHTSIRSNCCKDHAAGAVRRQYERCAVMGAKGRTMDL